MWDISFQLSKYSASEVDPGFEERGHAVYICSAATFIERAYHYISSRAVFLHHTDKNQRYISCYSMHIAMKSIYILTGEKLRDPHGVCPTGSITECCVIPNKQDCEYPSERPQCCGFRFYIKQLIFYDENKTCFNTLYYL